MRTLANEVRTMTARGHSCPQQLPNVQRVELFGCFNSVPHCCGQECPRAARDEWPPAMALYGGPVRRPIIDKVGMVSSVSKSHAFLVGRVARCGKLRTC